MKKIKWVMVLAVMLFMVTSMMGNNIRVKAANKEVIFEESKQNVLKPGETTSFKIPLKFSGEYMPMVKYSMKTDENQPFTISNFKLIYKSGGHEVSGISSSDVVYAVFDVKTREDASIGTYKSTMEVTYTTYSIEGENRASVTEDIYFDILEEKAPIQLTVSNLSYNTAWAESDIDLRFTIKNEGDIKAYNVYFNVDYTNSKTDIKKRYTSNNIKVGDLDKGATKAITLPISILSSATEGSKPLTINFTYKQFGVTEAKTSTYEINVDVKRKVVSEKTEAPYLQFEDITYGGGLKAGKSFVLEAKIRNAGDEKANLVKVSVDDSSLGKDTLLKEYLTDGISVGGIKSDGVESVSIPMSVSKQSLGGLLPLKLNVTYTDADGLAYNMSNTIYIDVAVVEEEKEEEPKVEEPKFLITNVGQSVIAPKAGDTVDVFFDIENNGLVDAVNVKIATTNLSAATFIPVNSEPYIYISKLAVGEKKTITIPLI